MSEFTDYLIDGPDRPRRRKKQKAAPDPKDAHISTLEAENARSRKALEKILRLYNPSRGNGPGRTREQIANDYFQYAEEANKIARAALGRQG